MLKRKPGKRIVWAKGPKIEMRKATRAQKRILKEMRLMPEQIPNYLLKYSKRLDFFREKVEEFLKKKSE